MEAITVCPNDGAFSLSLSLLSSLLSLTPVFENILFFLKKNGSRCLYRAFASKMAVPYCIIESIIERRRAVCRDQWSASDKSTVMNACSPT